MKTYSINGKTIKIKTHKFSGTQTKNEYINQIYKALSKIGVTEKYITLETNDKYTKLNWEINQNTFSFTCLSQNNQTQNLGAIAQAIQEDIRQIMRGIKNLNLVMKQYSQQQIQNSKPKTILDFETNTTPQPQTTIIKPTPQIQINSEIEAQIIIDEIKTKHPKIQNYHILPYEDKQKLRKAYAYLGKIVNF